MNRRADIRERKKVLARVVGILGESNPKIQALSDTLSGILALTFASSFYFAHRATELGMHKDEAESHLKIVRRHIALIAKMTGTPTKDIEENAALIDETAFAVTSILSSVEQATAKDGKTN